MSSLILSARYAENIGHLPNHFHDCHQIIYIVEGSVSITINTHTYCANAGSLVLISRFENHSIQINSSVYRRYMLRISPNLTCQEAKLLSVLVNRPSHFCHVLDLSQTPEVTDVLVKILAEWNARKDFREKLLDYHLFMLLVYLYRAHPALNQPQSKTLQLVQSIQLYFEENYSQPCTLKELAQRYHISPSYLSHLFKSVTGQSIMGYLTACRIVNAKRMLAETDLEVGQIISNCGFSDSSNFCRTFKSLTGFTPTQFRKANKS